jgi:guanylate kinase
MSEVVLIIGPSGSGKSFLQKKLVSEGYFAIVSSTTRNPRDGEFSGVDYHFKEDREDFFLDEYIEHAQVGNEFYGTPVKEFYKAKKIAHVVEPYGAKQILDKFKESKDVTIKVVFMDISKNICSKNLKGNKDSLSDKDLERLNRDVKDDIRDRLVETGIIPTLTIKALDYDIKTLLSRLS